jgi:glucosyl-dolichyl phosphate glucuronosyltransferase
MDLPVSVVIPTYDSERFETLAEVVTTVQHQTVAAAEIVVVVDHNQDLVDRVKREFPGVTVLPNAYSRGVSGNRNTGAFHTITPLIAFLDDDTSPGTDWLERLRPAMAPPNVVGAGGALIPKWERSPTWVPAEFLWAFGASYAGLPTTTARVRNVWSANMMVRRDAFTKVGGFRTDFGKLGGRSRPEDTELCLRMAEENHGIWMYVPDAPVGHEIPTERTTMRYFVTRCYNEGRGKIAMARLSHGKSTLKSENSYLKTLPAAVGRGLAATASGRDRHGASKAAAVVVGVGAAGVGTVVELMTRGQAGSNKETVEKMGANT